MNQDKNRENRISHDKEGSLPSFIQLKEVSDTKEESDKLVRKAEREFGLTAQEAVALIIYTKGLDMDLSDYDGNKLILDAGAGFGVLKTVLQKMGIDSSVVALDDMQSWGKNSPNIDTQGQIESMPFADESFDRIVASYAIPWTVDHSVDPDFMADQLGELVRVLKKGGVLRYRPLKMFRFRMQGASKDPMTPIYERAISKLKSLHEEDPSLEITITRAHDEEGFDEILEVRKKPNKKKSLANTHRE